MPHNRAVDAEPDAHEAQPAAEGPSAAHDRRGLKRVSYGWRITIGVLIYLVVAFVTVLYAPAALLNNWITGNDTAEKAKVVAAAGNLVLLALGGVIAVVTVGLSMSRHRQEREAAERDRQRLDDDRKREQARRDEVEAQRRIDAERALRDRFVTAVKLLSDPSATSRQAALFALGALADDWDVFGQPDEVQVCIEVLAGYLRSPVHAGGMSSLERVVRQAGFRIIRTHLRPTAPSGWSARRIDLGGIYLDFDVDLSGIVVMLRGVLDLQGATLDRGITLSLEGAVVGDAGVIALSGAGITPGSTVDLTGAQITNNAVVMFDGAQIVKRNEVILGSARLSDDGSVILPDGSRMIPLRSSP